MLPCHDLVMHDEILAKFNKKSRNERSVVTLRRMIWILEIGIQIDFLMMKLTVNYSFGYIGILKQKERFLILYQIGADFDQNVRLECMIPLWNGNDEIYKTHFSEWVSSDLG